MKPWKYRAKPLTSLAEDEAAELIQDFDTNSKGVNGTRVSHSDELANMHSCAHSDPTLNYTRERKLHCIASLQLYGDLLHSLMVWAGRYSELRLEHPGGIVLHAKPEHVAQAVTFHPWGVVYDETRAVFVTWGDVPTYALMDKRDLTTGALLGSERVAA